MASIFTYQEEPPRVHSPWSASGNVTPQKDAHSSQAQHTSYGGQMTTITKLEPERQDGPTEYKLHLLLRSRKYHPAAAYHTIAQQNDAVTRPPSEVSSATLLQQQITASRQTRLQQLTTQLLWRLQQSSPFHSSSNADLVLPMLPEATPRLGVPARPAKLLPGLEESQGALYEIGVADDGTLVGLVEEELEESLNNLRAMAASLGCVVDILRRVLVGEHERGNIDSIKIWVAEVLVRPDTKSPRIPPLEEVDASLGLLHQQSNDAKEKTGVSEQLRVAVTGTTTAGKSSLVGTLTTSTLDNGRGKSRLSLLKHRHEIASGVTSSVAQELLGYRQDQNASQTVVNYATGDVSAWPDIHNLASRLIFLSDSPGLARYAKSTFRTLVSWNPSWTLMCVAADEDDATNGLNLHSNSAPMSDDTYPNGAFVDSADLSLAHLDVCLKLDLPLVVIVTKMDIATKSGLKSVLSKILSALKLAARTPALLGSPSNIISGQDESVDVTSELAFVSERESEEISALVARIKQEADNKIVPIVLTSSVTGVGIGKLHTLLRELPSTYGAGRLPEGLEQSEIVSTFHVDETFAIPPSKVYSESREGHSADQGIVLCGHVAAGKIAIGDQLRLGPFISDPESSPGEDGSYPPRSASYCNDNGRRPVPRALSGLLSKSLQYERHKLPSTPVDGGSIFLDVHVVSLRSLRLPVRSMLAGETGTVGVQPMALPSVVPLSRARKGMVLTSVPCESLFGYRSFAATFAASDFTHAASPTLILGGHAIIYTNSIRAAVKATALILEEDNLQSDPSPLAEVFDFDGDEQDVEVNALDTSLKQEARVSFRFVSSMERMEVGDRVLVVPTVTTAGPVTGPPIVSNGLGGFVGRICDVYT